MSSTSAGPPCQQQVPHKVLRPHSSPFVYIPKLLRTPVSVYPGLQRPFSVPKGAHKQAVDTVLSPVELALPCSSTLPRNIGVCAVSISRSTNNTYSSRAVYNACCQPTVTAKVPTILEGPQNMMKIPQTLAVDCRPGLE
ncbi:hypothetical protein BDV93DRAFT_518069 [Ceratobasidium sp. AG-I]|nr:hypothetical protein BDV93DRAFT_518069 [Ceratobasidium sp. AG-I]